MLCMSLMMSSIALGVLLAVLLSSERRWWKILLVGIPSAFVFCFQCLGFVFGPFYTLLLATFVSLVWHFANGPRWVLIPLLPLCLVTGHLILYIQWVLPDQRNDEWVRQQIVKLEINNRLKRPAKPAILGELSHNSLDKLDEWVSREHRGPWHFSSLHEEEVRRFINNPGFGFIRAYPPKADIEEFLPTRSPIRQPNQPLTSQSRVAVEHPLLSQPDFVDQHRHQIVEFAFPLGWGWERTPGEFWGFQPHQIGKNAKHEYRSESWSVDFKNGWKITSLELIGLLMHPKPVV
jgi:hypothetical protein